MHILPINYKTKQFLYNQNQNNNYITNPYQIQFEGRVDKSWERFSNFHEGKERLTTTLINFQETIDDKLKIKASEAIKNAYADLNLAKTIEDVKRLFPKEKELFKDLTTIKDTISKRGLIGIYKDFQEELKNGILQSGDDFTVYLLRKLFVETKIYKEINDDLDNDLLPDVSYYFREKYGHNKYVTTEIIQALGIYPFDKNMRNSLKFTKEGYSDGFGLTISIALLSRLKDMSEEERETEIEQNSGQLVKWWNDMSPEEQFDLATSVDVQEEGYKRYKKFDNESRRINRAFIESFPEFYPSEEMKKTKKHSKLNNKDIYILWMQKNLAKYTGSMTEQELAAFKIERSAKMARRWQEMTPEQRVEFIKSIKEGIEPVQIAMIDAWNHSKILIRTLREFLKEQQIFKPVELVYDTEEFMKLQSKVMTEFWIKNKDLADRFGITMKASHLNVKEAIQNGTYEKFKEDVLLEKDRRIKKLQEEYKAEEDEIKRVQEEKIKEKEAAIPKEDVQYRNEFAEVYKKSIDKHGILPPAYTKEMAEIFLDKFPKDIVIPYTKALKNKEEIPEYVLNYIRKEQEKNNSPRTERMQRALEAAIAAEMTSKGATHSFFQMDINTLINLLNHRYENRNVPKSRRLDKYRITALYNKFEKDLSDEELNTITSTYFNAKREMTEEEENMCIDYFKSYGTSLNILFSYKSAYSDSVKYSFNEKFLNLMPNKIKEFIHPFIQSSEDIFEENEINSLIAHMYNRFKYLPDDILKLYTKEIGTTIRLDRAKHANEYLEKFKNSFFTKAAADKNQTFPSFEKKLMSKEEILKILAIEQAMADEFYRVSGNDLVYSKDFEQLLNYYDSTAIMKNHDMLNLYNKDGNIMFTVKEKPDTKILQTKYLEYLNAIKSNKEIFNSDRTINKDKLLYCLNNIDGRPEKLLGTKKRIDSYFTEQNEKIQTPAESAKPNTEKPPIPEQLKNDFRFEYARRSNKHILPSNYTKEIADIILATFPKEALEEYLLNPSATFTNEVLYKNCSGENLKKLKRIQHALAAAIASELAAKTGDYSLYGETVDTLIPKLESQELDLGHKKRNKIDTDNIKEKYNYYKRDLSKGDLVYITNNFFMTDHKSTKEEDKLIMDYLDEYGKSAEILFSVNISLPLNAKDAFNNKFLNSMPEEARNVATPLLRTREDLKTNYDIEIVRRQLAKRFDSVIPPEPLNIYTREVAKMMRLMNQPDADAELKELYGMEAFKKSISQEEDTKDGNLASVLKLPKYYITNDTNKLYMLAIEQAMADELYRVSKNNIVYKYELEDLALWYELSSFMKNKYQNGLDLSDPDTGEGFKLKERPNKNNIMQKYVTYMKKFEADENIFTENGDLNREEILSCLRNSDKPEKDKYIKERIDGYFED